MADSISRKDNKLSVEIAKIKSKNKDDKEAKKTKGELNDMSTSVDSSFRNSKFKKLSQKEKKEMLAEYERVISKLKELEFRNKKRESFKYKFEGLKYFKTLNGHSVYSERMSYQAKADKDTISSMMAYNQLGAAFDVTFEEFVRYIRPERRREFIDRCKHSPALSHSLMGMAKVIEYYNQRDFTRAYAAMVFFGLENDISLMEEFLKVKFNTSFIKQIDDFKDMISSMSNFEEKEFREEAGKNVINQSDSFMTGVKASFSGESVGETIKKKAESYKQLKEKHNGNFLGVGLEAANNTIQSIIEKRDKKIKENNDAIYKAAKEVFGDKINDTKIQSAIESLIIKKIEREESSAREELINRMNGQSNTSKFKKFKEQLEKANTPEEREKIKKELEDFVNSVKSDKVQSIAFNRIYNAENKRRQKISEKAEIEAKLSKATPEEKPKLEEQLKIVKEELSKIPTFEQIVAELCKDSRLPAEEVENISKEFKEAIDLLLGNVDYTKPMSERCNFESFIQEYGNNEKKLEKMLYKEMNELEEAKEAGDLEKVAKLEEEITLIKGRIENLKQHQDERASIVLNIKQEKILSLLSGEKEINEKSLELILKSNNIKDEDKKRIIDIKKKGIPENGLSVDDKNFVDNLLIESLVKVYISKVECIKDNSYIEIEKDILGKIDKEITSLYNQQKVIRNDELKTQEEKDKEIYEINVKIDILKKAQKKIQSAKDKIQSQKQKEIEESKKPPEEILENMLTHAIEFKLTRTVEIDGKKQYKYIDEMTEEEFQSKVSDESLLKSVTVILNSMETIINLNLETISQKNMDRLKDAMQRNLKLLEKLKGKISEEKFEILEEKSNWVQRKLSQLSEKVSEVKNENNKIEEHSAEEAAENSKPSQVTQEEKTSDSLLNETKNPSANTPEEKEEVKKDLEDFVNSEKLDKVQRLVFNKIYNAENKRRQKISEKAEIEAKLSKAMPEEKPKLEEQLKIVEEELSKMPTSEQVIAELCKDSKLPKEEAEKIGKQFKETIDLLFGNVDYTKPMSEQGNFESFIQEYGNNEKKLRKMLYKEMNELEEAKEAGDLEKVAKLEEEITLIKGRIEKLKQYQDERASIVLRYKQEKISEVKNENNTIEERPAEEATENSKPSQVTQEEKTSDSLLNEIENPPANAAGKTGLKENKLINQSIKT